MFGIDTIEFRAIFGPVKITYLEVTKLAMHLI